MKFKFRFFMVIVFIFYGAGCRYQEGGGAPSGKTCGVEGSSACRVSFRALASTPVYSMGNRYAWRAISELVGGSLY